MPIKAPNAGHPALFNPAAVFRGSAVAIIFSITGSLLLGIIFHFSNLKESSLPLASSTLLFISVFCGGFTASKHSQAKGLMHGIGVSIIIFVLIWLFIGIIMPEGISFIPLFKKFLLCFISGSLGGILGVSR